MKFHEIIPGLIAGKKYCCKNQKYLYQYIYHDGNDEILWSNDAFVPKDMITTWLYNTTVEWEEYKEYPKDLDFVEACRLARDNDAIISTTGRVKYDWDNGMLCEYSTRKPFEPDLFIFQNWHVVGYKGEQ